MEKTKKQLEEALLKLEGEVKQILKERDARTQEVLDKGKEVNALKQQIQQRDAQIEQLSSKFNELAKLFDEYIKSFDDIIEVQKLFLRNNLRSQELMQAKIKAFNGEGEKDK